MIDLTAFNDNINIYKEWIDQDNIEEYSLKILLLLSVLADHKLAFRGTLKDMCQWLGIQSCTNNNRAIKEALQNLSDKGYIFYLVEKRTYHVSILDKGMKDKQIYKVRKVWIEAFKKYNKDNKGKVIDKDLSVDWIKILKIFIHIYYLKPGRIITIQQLADETGTKEETARKALNAIVKCNLPGICVEKRVVKECYEDDEEKTSWRTLGQEISILVDFDSISPKNYKI